LPAAAPMCRARSDSALGGRLVILVASLAVAGCRPEADIRSDDIRSYVVPRNAEPTLVAASPAAGPAAAPSGRPRPAGEVRYVVPEGWTDGGADGMRLATLLIGDPADKREVTVIPASGTLESNVVRWQKQLDPDADAAAVEAGAEAAIAAAETVDVDGTPATVVLLRSAADDGQAILGAMLPVDEAAALFVKFRGDAEVALRERERFSRFVSSLRWKK
jgi:hypothetical protein